MNDEIRGLFQELADLSPPDRERIFRERRTEPTIRAEVESLLAFDNTEDRSLTGVVGSTAQNMLDNGPPGEMGRCGAYRLVRLLGSGGMGSVYLAERTDGEIQQRVAVKLLRADIDHPSWRGRFLKERQLLASLHHPSVVHVIDAGHTSDGRPYLVMEYVEGVPIDVYARAIGLRERLRLFLRVCEGISHAHQHLIIHRDLKPSNILVEASGQPKLLDFGIAKPLDESEELTQTVDRLLTPGYASPEQLGGASQTTATDVYSLGAVLYKMLTGVAPFAKAPVAPREEILPPSRINKDIGRDLDFIVLKALRVEPEERYASVDAFAWDVRALLEYRPVLARSGNAWYRTRKFLRRYWVPVTAAVLVTASLAAGLYVANRARVIAEQRFGQLRQLSSKVFELDKAIKTLPGSTAARQRLVSASLEYLEGLASDARGDLDLDQEIGEAYERVAKVQGVPNELNLGEFAKAEVNLRKADSFIETVLASRPQSRSALRTSAVIANDRMILAETQRRTADAQAYAQKAGARLDAFLRLGRAQDSELDEAAGIYANIAQASNNMHLYAQAVPFAEKCIEVARALPARGQGGTRRSIGLSLLANARRYQGDLDAASQAIQEARNIAEQIVYPDETSRMLGMYGILFRQGLILGEDGAVSLGRTTEAIEPLQKALDITEAAAAKSPSDYATRSRVGNCGVHLAGILNRTDPKRALAVYDLVILRLGEVPKNVSARRDLAAALADSSYALRRLHRAPEAKQRIDAAFAILKDTKDYPAQQISFERSGVYQVVNAWADWEAENGSPNQAVDIYEDLLSGVMAAKPEPLTDLRNTPSVSELYAAMARVYRQTGAVSKAESMETRRLELWQHWDSQLPNNAYVHGQLQAAQQRR
jgi:tRNA A-37 threonylcarbamoyl transferase component Bud32/tetratricopeptide (TPR) repeat protein